MKKKTLEYNLGEKVRAFTTTHEVNTRRTHPEPLVNLSGIPIERIVIPHQVHDTHCLLIDDTFLQLPTEERAACLEGIDAVITALPHTLLCISTADCIPVIIYDTAHHAAANIHAGWKGTVQRIVEKTFVQMQHTFGTQAQDCRAIIGPGISLQSFEVGDEVYERFHSNGFDMNSIARRYPDTKNPDKEKWHINLPLCNQQQLMHCGIFKENIYVSDICTFRDTNYFSARREGVETGRNMTCLTLL